jgi:hypothetical protein
MGLGGLAAGGGIVLVTGGTRVSNCCTGAHGYCRRCGWRSHRPAHLRQNKGPTDSGAPQDSNQQENPEYNQAVKQVKDQLGVDKSLMTKFDQRQLDGILRNVQDEITGRNLKIEQIKPILENRIGQWWGAIRARHM